MSPRHQRRWEPPCQEAREGRKARVAGVRRRLTTSKCAKRFYMHGGKVKEDPSISNSCALSCTLTRTSTRRRTWPMDIVGKRTRSKSRARARARARSRSRARARARSAGGKSSRARSRSRARTGTEIDRREDAKDAMASA